MKHTLDILDLQTFSFSHVIASDIDKRGTKYFHATAMPSIPVIVYVVYINDSYDLNNIIYAGEDWIKAIQCYNTAFDIND
ncbi:MAG: hypothetical protein GOV02_02900 [Candidatus Aenigmarchaeota archaeon]|nr:hypothetical protein [Candidatus Aenigmarchaeota archaeon]